MLAVIAGLTETIRIGTAGVLLRLQSPLRVAKAFRALQVIYPNRIDLGIARGGTNTELERLLRDGATHDQSYEGKVQELLGYLRGTTAVAVNPLGVWPPEVWLLGSNTRSMNLAAEQGTAFCFAQFLARDGVDCVSIINAYHQQFVPSLELSKSQCTIAVAGICAPTDEEALSLLPVGGPVSVTSTLIGSPSSCRRELEVLQARTGVNEFIFSDLCAEPNFHLRSYRLLAEVLQLHARQVVK